MVDLKYGEIYISLYLTRQRQIRKWVKILLIVFSSAGIMSWKVWELAPLFSGVVTSLFQLFSLVENHVFLTESQLEELNELSYKYTNLFYEVELLWQNLEDKSLNIEEIKSKFYSLRKLKNEINNKDFKLDLTEVVKLMDKADSITLKYLETYHG